MENSKASEPGNKTVSPGTLYVVATPIGHRADISFRALEVLQSVNLILVEDTRSFKALALKYQIETPTKSFHEHNEQKQLDYIMSLLGQGDAIALVSEAGTPTISDPGFRLVRECRIKHHPISSIPGPCSVIAALSISGMETDEFSFFGFLSLKLGKRRQQLKHAIESDVTAVFFESPHRLLSTLELLAELSQNCELFLAKELTKLFEETFIGRVDMVRQKLAAPYKVRGEWVIILRANKHTVRKPLTH